jgi:hypothetical protein
VSEQEEDEGIELLLSEPEIEIWLNGCNDRRNEKGRDEPVRDHS